MNCLRLNNLQGTSIPIWSVGYCTSFAASWVVVNSGVRVFRLLTFVSRLRYLSRQRHAWEGVDLVDVTQSLTTMNDLVHLATIPILDNCSRFRLRPSFVVVVLFVVMDDPFMFLFIR